MLLKTPKITILSCELQPLSWCSYYVTTDVPISYGASAKQLGAHIINANGQRLARELYTHANIKDFVPVGLHKALIVAPKPSRYFNASFLQTKITQGPLAIIDCICLHKKQHLFQITTSKSLRGDYFLLDCCNYVHQRRPVHTTTQVRWWHERPNVVVVAFAPRFRADEARVRKYVLKKLGY